MSTSDSPRTITIVSACMRPDGTPTFALTEISVTSEQAENGFHYGLAEARLLEGGYEEPFVHFSEDEAPGFLHPAVRQHLGSSSNNTDSSLPVLVEDC